MDGVSIEIFCLRKKDKFNGVYNFIKKGFLV